MINNVSSILFKVSKESDSISLYADGEHLRTDVYSSLGVLVGLIIIKITGYSILDPVIAILVAAFIFKTGYFISKKALMNLLDHSLPVEDIEQIKKIIDSFNNLVTLKEGGIKARQVGPGKDIDLILQFPKNTPIFECHNICDEIEKQIRLMYPNCSISIHSEPVCFNKDCSGSCSHCYGQKVS